MPTENVSSECDERFLVGSRWLRGRNAGRRKEKRAKGLRQSPLNVTTLGSGETRYGEEGFAREEGINQFANLPYS